MDISEEICCPYCKKVFYLHAFRLQEAKEKLNQEIKGK